MVSIKAENFIKAEMLLKVKISIYCVLRGFFNFVTIFYKIKIRDLVFAKFQIIRA